MNRVYDNRPCMLGEGALWHPEAKQLFWFDILAGKLLSRRGDDQLEWDLGEMASAAGWVSQHELLIGTESALVLFDIRTGAIEHVAGLEAEDMETRSNDGRADPHGGFWISTMGKQAEPDVGAIYRYYRGQLHRVVTGLTIPNAISFAPAGKLAYYTDGPTRQVMAQPLGDDGWPEGAPRVLIDLRPVGRIPDGAVTDAEGDLWIAHWSAGEVAQYAPDGRLLGTVAVGAKRCTCPAFGGPDLATLYVTTAREGMDAAALRADPLAGQLFTADPGAPGRPEPRVIL